MQLAIDLVHMQEFFPDSPFVSAITGVSEAFIRHLHCLVVAIDLYGAVRGMLTGKWSFHAKTVTIDICLNWLPL